jgi:hypothetical protein
VHHLRCQLVRVHVMSRGGLEKRARVVFCFIKNQACEGVIR